MKRLFKSRDKKIAGVCGGLSHYINPDLDPILMRAGWLAITLFNPFMLIIYLVLALALPDTPYETA